MQTESKIDRDEVIKDVIEFMQSFVDMNNLLEQNTLVMNKYESYVAQENVYFVKKLYDRYGDENRFVHSFMVVKFYENIFKITFNLQIDDDRDVSNKIYAIKNNYGENFKKRFDHGLNGGWSYDFRFNFDELDLFKKLMSEVI